MRTEYPNSKPKDREREPGGEIIQQRDAKQPFNVEFSLAMLFIQCWENVTTEPPD